MHWHQKNWHQKNCSVAVSWQKGGNWAICGKFICMALPVKYSFDKYTLKKYTLSKFAFKKSWQMGICGKSICMAVPVTACHGPVCRFPTSFTEPPVIGAGLSNSEIQFTRRQPGIKVAAKGRIASSENAENADLDPCSCSWVWRSWRI